MIHIKRVRDPVSNNDGKRLLVERLWPRGVKKQDLKIDGWIKDAAPSTALRKWFDHDPAKWREFQRRYRAEIRKTPALLEPILAAAAEGDVTLLFSSHDAKHNNVVALQTYLQARK
ncbi:MAG TPA: DUF488 family protein [Candidatus Kapabacteria bacterium]|nr:DUF488 family protein [Candidatus Kapabacteria bacterium]